MMIKNVRIVVLVAICTHFSYVSGFNNRERLKGKGRRVVSHNSSSSKRRLKGTSSSKSSTKSSSKYNSNSCDIGVEDFKGIKNVYSHHKGVIEIDWDASPFELESDDASFDVFVALGEYDFQSELASISVDNLAEIFEAEPWFQHIKVDGSDTHTISIATPFSGEVHSLLVTAQDGSGEYSSNIASRKIVASSVDPHIREDINVVGVFLPTSRLDIEEEDSPVGTEHTLSFTGPVSVEAQSLTVGDFITGFTSDLDPFVLSIVDTIEIPPTALS